MRKTVKFLVLVGILILVSAAVVLAGGQGEKAQKKAITIGYCSPGLDAFQAGVMYSVIHYSEAKGWAVIPEDANRDSHQQANQVEYLISLGVNAIVAVPEDSQAFCASVAKARQANIPVYTIDRAPIGCKVNMVVQADNVTAGTQSGTEVVKFLTQKYGSPKGTVLELQGEMAQNVAQLRHKGFIDVMDQNPGIKVISKPTHWDSNQFYQNTMDVVGSQPIDAVFMHSDSAGGTPVVQALTQLGKLVPAGQPGHIYVAAIDGTANAIDLIRKGSIDQTSSQPNPDFGILVDYIEMEFKGQKIQLGPVVKEGALWSPAKIVDSDVGPMLMLATTNVTKANVDDKRLWGNH
jgi:ABC-type sugar transport system substrate-binding protein